jgi:hypothetical protein
MTVARRLIPRGVWQKMPRSRQRLITEGPAQHGREAVQTAVIVLASELRLHGVGEEQALDWITTSLPDDYNHRGNDAQRLYSSAVRWAYKADPPILIGCPKPADSHKLRPVFAPYCDADCQQSCPIRQGRQVPEVALINSPFEPLLVSTIWANLGMTARELWRVMASLAVVRQENYVIAASTRWLVLRMNNVIPKASVERHHRRLVELGLVRVISAPKGLKQVIPLTERQVEELERKLGTDVQTAQRKARIVNEWDDYAIDHPEFTGFWEDDIEEAREAVRSLPTPGTEVPPQLSGVSIPDGWQPLKAQRLDGVEYLSDEELWSRHGSWLSSEQRRAVRRRLSGL